MASKAPTGSAAFTGLPGPAAWTAGYERCFETNRQALDQWAKVSEAAAKSMLDLSREMTRFCLARFQADLSACEAVSHAHGAADVSEAQRRFLEQMTAQYFEHASKLADLVTKAAKAGFTVPGQKAE